MSGKANQDATTPDVSTSPEEWEFEEVVSDAPTVIVFDTIGDQFIGKYNGIQHVEARASREEYERFAFTGIDGNRYAVSKSRTLDDLMKKVPVGQWVRITYTGDIPQSKGFHPMKDFTVEVKR
jgi:hypothetical protein